MDPQTGGPQDWDDEPTEEQLEDAWIEERIERWMENGWRGSRRDPEDDYDNDDDMYD